MCQLILTKTPPILSNGAMSRRAIALVIVFLGALVVANIVVLAVWLPNRKNSAAKPQASNVTPVVASPAAFAPPGPNNSSPAGTAGAGAASARAGEASSDFALERQLTSPSGNLRIKYLRDRKTKTRRIAVEDVHRPGGSAVLSESKRSAWALVSPDDQWIAVDERNPTDGGGVRLYHRSGGSSVQYIVAESAGPEGRGLQNTVWQSYLNATHGEPNTPRRSVTIDATGWENDSRKLYVSVAYLPTPDNPDVPEPWSCTYDVASKHVEPIPNQPTVGPDMVNASTGSEDDNQAGAAPEQDSQQETAANNSFADNGDESAVDETEDAEYPGERFPATRLDELAVPDVNESSLDDITYAINEMFARHGAEFKDKKVAKQFSEFSWYKPRPGASFDQVKQEFSDLEKQNLEVLERCRDAKLAAAKRKSRPVRGQRAEEESTAEKVMRGIKTWQDFGAPMPPHP